MKTRRSAFSSAQCRAFLYASVPLWAQGCVAGATPTDSTAAMAQPELARVALCVRDTQQSMVLSAERATTFEQRRIGLMGREHMAGDEGMLFVYEQERAATDTYWMYQTLLPLDIAYLGPEGRIRAIGTMEPCTSEEARNCPTYQAGVPYWAALEVNKGFFARNGFAVGSRVTPSAPAECRPGA